MRGAGVGEPPRRAARNVRARMRAAAARPDEDEGNIFAHIENKVWGSTLMFFFLNFVRTSKYFVT